MLKIKERKPKRLDNVEFVTEMMEHSKFGPLAQAFVIEAISRYAEQVAASKPENYGQTSFFSPESWIGVGKEIAEKMDARIKS